MRRLPLLLVVSLLIVVGAFFWRRAHEAPPLYTTGAGVPDAATYGDPDFAIKRAKELYTAYKATGWNSAALPRDLQFLPDKKFAEKDIDRDPRVSDWIFPHRLPLYADVAFYADLYARQNRTYYQDGKFETRPSGFYIVCWKSGKIEKIGVEKLRLLQTPEGLIEVFPGIPGYERGTPHVAYAKSP